VQLDPAAIVLELGRRHHPVIGYGEAGVIELKEQAASTIALYSVRIALAIARRQSSSLL